MSASPARAAIVVVPAIVALVLSISFWQGMRGTDDLGYAQEAVSLLRGDRSPPVFHQASHHESRVGVTFPLAAILFLFGPSNLTMALLPLLCTAMTASLVAWLGHRLWGEAVGLTAGLLYAVFPQTIGLATFYVPEPIANLELCAAGALFLTTVEGQEVAGRRLFLAGLLIGVAYLTTEVGALMLPVLYAYLLVTRRIRPRDGWLVAGFVTVVVLELVYHGAVHGDPWYRFLSTGAYPDDPMVRGANTGSMTYRLLKAYPSMFIYPSLDFGIFGPLLVLGVGYGLWKWRGSSLFLFWAGAILLFYNFMTASFKQYVALPVAPRLLAPACVPLLVLAAKLLVDLWTRTRARAAVAVRYGGATVGALGAGGLILASLTAMYLNATPTLTAAIARNAELAAGFLRQHAAVTVVSDPATAKALQFYRGYRSRDAFLGYEAATRLGAGGLGEDPTKPVFVVVNGPVLNEEQVSGHRYGGGLSLTAQDREAVSRLVAGQGAPAYSTRFRSGRFLESLLQYQAVRSLLGAYSYRLTRNLTAENPPLGQIRIFRYSDLDHEPATAGPPHAGGAPMASLGT